MRHFEKKSPVLFSRGVDLKKRVFFHPKKLLRNKKVNHKKKKKKGQHKALLIKLHFISMIENFD